MGGAKPVIVHRPHDYIRLDCENERIEGVAPYFQSWPASDIVGWSGKDPAELGKNVDEGGCWTGSGSSDVSNQRLHYLLIKSLAESSSVDAFPFVGAVPNHDSQFMAAGFTGHGTFILPAAIYDSWLTKSGMPRILLSTVHITPLVLTSLGLDFTPPSLVAAFPPLPKPFEATSERVERLQQLDTSEIYEASVKNSLESAKKPFCVDVRRRLGLA